jgi:serine/threonine-protein phosphatase PGAM5
MPATLRCRRRPVVGLALLFAVTSLPTPPAASPATPGEPTTSAPAAPTAAPPATASAAAGTGRRELWLVRHGAYDTEDTRDDAIGRALVPIGVAQARLAGHRLASLPGTFDAVLASPLTRARETAAVIANDLGLPVEQLADLAECTPPTRRQDIMAEEKPEDLAACLAQFERLAASLLQPAVGGDRREVVVCHGNVIRWLVTRALDVDPLAWLVMSVGHASLTRVVVEPDGMVRVLAVGDVGHLPPNLQTGAVRDPERDLLVPATPGTEPRATP